MAAVQADSHLMLGSSLVSGMSTDSVYDHDKLRCMVFSGPRCAACPMKRRPVSDVQANHLGNGEAE